MKLQDSHTIFSVSFLPACLAAESARKLSNMSCRGMPTGQTSLHRPHRLDASGRSEKLSGHSSGERTAPIGPMYGEPYDNPFAAVYTGQAFIHAPHLIHKRISL